MKVKNFVKFWEISQTSFQRRIKPIDSSVRFGINKTGIQSFVWVAHGAPLKNRNPMGPHWGNCKYLFSNQILSDKVHIAWKLLYFCIDSNEEQCNIEIGSRFIWGFLKSFQFKCFEISLIFHGLLLWLQKKI
jgi:hypothetical protein